MSRLGEKGEEDARKQIGMRAGRMTKSKGEGVTSEEGDDPVVDCACWQWCRKD